MAVGVIQEWNDLHSYTRKIVLLPLRWEAHTAPEYGSRPQEVINRAIVDHCDLLLGIFWTRIGSPTGIADSGTLEEVARVVDAQKPVMLYFSKIGVDPDNIDAGQLEKLRQFKEKTLSKGSLSSTRRSTSSMTSLRGSSKRRVRSCRRTISLGIREKVDLGLEFGT